MTGRLKDPNFLLKCIIEDIESNISKADEEPKKEKVIDYNKTVSSFEREEKDEIARQDAWKNMKESGQKGIKISNRKETKGKRYKKVETEYPNRMYVEGGKGILGKKNLIRTSFIPLDSAKTIEFKTSSSKLIQSIGKEGLLRDLKSLTQYKDFLDITALANVINTKQDIPIRINTGEKNKKAQILQYAKTTGKKRVKEIFNRIHSLLMDAKKKAHEGKHKKAITSLNKIILDNYDAFNQVVSVKAKKVKNISQIKELETSDERVKDTTRLFFAELAATVKEAFSNLKDDSEEDNASSNQKQIAKVLSNNLSGNTYKSNDPKLIYNILTNLDSAKEVPKQLFGDAIDAKTSDIVSGRTPKGKQRLPRTEEQIAMIEQIKRERKGRENIFESLKQMFDHSDNKKSRRKIKELSESIREKNRELNGLLELFGKTPEEGLMERIKRASNRMEQEMKEAKKILNNDIKKAETNKIFDIIDIVKSSKGIKVIFREEPYRKGMKGYNAYMDSIKSILASLDESVGNEKALDIFTKYGKLITGSKTQQSPDKRQKASSFLSRKKKEVATKKKLLSKKERKMLQLPTDLREDIRDISEELLKEMVNFNAFLLVTDKENESSPAYWYNKIRQLVGQSEGKLERIKTPQKEKNLVGKYYKKLNLALNLKGIEDFEKKIDLLQEDEKDLEIKLKEYSDELANFEGGMKGLVELSKSFEEMKKPYIDLFIEVSDLKSQLSDKKEKDKSEEDIQEAAKKAVEDFKRGKESAKAFSFPVKPHFEHVKDRTSGIYEPLIYESKKEYEEKQKDLIEERKFTYVSRNKNKKYDEITDEDLKEVTVKQLLQAKLISEKDIAPYPDTDRGKSPKTLREKDYYLGEKNIKFYNAVVYNLVNEIKESQKSNKDKKDNIDKEKIKEQYLEKREELLELEKEITDIIIKSPYFDKRAKSSRITGKVILNRDPKDVWYKSIVSDTRKKEYFIEKETFMGIMLEGQIKNEAVSIFEIMGGSYSMNLDAITDYKKLNLQLKDLSKRVNSAIKLREKIDKRFAEKTQKVLREEE